MKRVLVIGDIIADVYRECVFKKMCPDAPLVRAIVEQRIDTRPGGAANVAVNLAALAPNVHVDLIGALDVDLARTIKYRSGNRVGMSYCVFDQPLRKERVLLDGDFLLRVDGPNYDEFHSDEVLGSLEDYLARNDPDLILLSDYGSGAIDASLPLLLEHRTKLLADTKIRDLSVFRQGGTRTLLAKLNDEEWRAALEAHHSPEEFFSFVVVTHGARGSSLIMRSKPDEAGRSVCQTLFARALQSEAVDVCGCGDTFLAAMAAAMLEDRDPYSAIQFANAAAATVVDQPRTAVADLGRTLGLLGWTREAC